MSSTNIVNFSLRQNKSIERAIVFDGLMKLGSIINMKQAVYVGLGSVWFADFILAHRLLGIETMISMEDDPVTYKRARYNIPYRTVEVIEGQSRAVIPELLQRAELRDLPWIVWLDYDEALLEDRRDELSDLVPALPRDSVLITTFNAHGASYNRQPAGRPERIHELFGSAAPERISVADTRDRDQTMRILAATVTDFLVGVGVMSGAAGGFVPAFRLMYVDNAPMVTVGGVLPSAASAEGIEAVVSDAAWPGVLSEVVSPPPLTAKEVQALQALLPNPESITRAEVQAIGFDLEEDHIGFFADHYLRYPQFAQLAR